MSLHLITVATHSERYLPVLEAQTRDKNIKLEKLGMGKKYVGHFMKDLETLEYLKKTRDEDIVVFVDGFDTIFIGEPDEVLEKFNRLDCDILISTENIGYLSFIHSSVFERVNGNYINTGLYMGKAGKLRNFLEEMYSLDYSLKSNQKTWSNHLYKLQQEKRLGKIKIDHESNIFLNNSFTTSNNLRVKGERVLVSGKRPCFIQGNGCEDLSYYIRKNGYSHIPIDSADFFVKKVKYNIKAIFSIYNPILSFYIYLVILLIFLAVFFIQRHKRISSDPYFYLG